MPLCFPTVKGKTWTLAQSVVIPIYCAVNLLSAMAIALKIAKHCTVYTWWRRNFKALTKKRMHGENLGASPLNNNLMNGTLMDSTFKCHFLFYLFWLFSKQLRLQGSSILWSRFTVSLCYVTFCKSVSFCFMYKYRIS